MFVLTGQYSLKEQGSITAWGREYMIVIPHLLRRIQGLGKVSAQYYTTGVLVKQRASHLLNKHCSCH